MHGEWPPLSGIQISILNENTGEGTPLHLSRLQRDVKRLIHRILHESGVLTGP